MLIFVEGHIFGPCLQKRSEIRQAGIQCREGARAQCERENCSMAFLFISASVFIFFICLAFCFHITFISFHVSFSGDIGSRTAFLLFVRHLINFRLCFTVTFCVLLFVFDCTTGVSGGLLGSWLAFGWLGCCTFASRDAALLRQLSGSIIVLLAIFVHFCEAVCLF